MIRMNTTVKLDKIPLELTRIQVISKDLKLSTDKITKLEAVIHALLEEPVEFSFTNFLKSICGIKKKKIFIYDYGLENLKNILDIKNFLRFNQDMAVVKEVLFDNNQRITFDVMSKFINIGKFFNQINDQQLSFKNYDVKEFKEFFISLEVLFKRNNETDNKIISFISSKLEE